MDGPLVTKIEDGLDDDITEEKRFETIENVETDMTDEEIKQFEEDWAKLRNPDVTKKENSTNEYSFLYFKVYILVRMKYISST